MQSSDAPWFIRPLEPWRNGVVEPFNNHYQQKFLDPVLMRTVDELTQSLYKSWPEYGQAACFKTSN